MADDDKVWASREQLMEAAEIAKSALTIMQNWLIMCCVDGAPQEDYERMERFCAQRLRTIEILLKGRNDEGMAGKPVSRGRDARGDGVPR